MKALSVHRPWAELIVAGVKPLENRTWYMAHRGPLAIHATQYFDETWRFALDEAAAAAADRHFRSIGHPAQTPIGIVGVARVVNCTRVMLFPAWQHPDCYAILFTGARKALRPYRVRGQQGMFSIDDSIIPALQLRRAGPGAT